jgi:sucrose-6-phosphate hydrolase SacC (GH32 family)
MPTPTGRWVMVVWSDADGNGVDFFVSPDLRDWERVSRFAAGWLFECPDFTSMALDGDVTCVLRDARGSYVVGDFDGRDFRTSWAEPCTLTRNTGGAGSDYYAAQSFQNLPDASTSAPHRPRRSASGSGPRPPGGPSTTTWVQRNWTVTTCRSRRTGLCR